jgi:superoxide dismutase
VPETIRTAVRNNGGGHVNHQFFWDILGPRGGGAPKDTIADAIKRDFGSFEQFQSLFTDAATRHFGAGWAFLVVNPSSPGMWSMSGSARSWLQARPGVTSTETAGGARPSVTVVPIL